MHRPFLRFVSQYGLPAGYVESAVEPPEQFAVTLLEYWRIFYKRKWLILSIVAAFLVLGGLRTLMPTPLYTATVRLQIDLNVAKIVEGEQCHAGRRLGYPVYANAVRAAAEPKHGRTRGLGARLGQRRRFFQTPAGSYHRQHARFLQAGPIS